MQFSELVPCFNLALCLDESQHKEEKANQTKAVHVHKEYQTKKKTSNYMMKHKHHEKKLACVCQQLFAGFFIAKRRVRNYHSTASLLSTRVFSFALGFKWLLFFFLPASLDSTHCKDVGFEQKKSWVKNPDSELNEAKQNLTRYNLFILS